MADNENKRPYVQCSHQNTGYVRVDLIWKVIDSTYVNLNNKICSGHKKNRK